MNTIKINGIDYKIKYTIRALFIFEQITGKAFKIETLLDNYIFFYAMILANNETVLDWDAFLDALDENPTLFAEMNETVAEQQKKDNIFNNEESDTEEKKKLSVSELYAILVIQLGYSPEYVLDKMQWYEINAALKYAYYGIKDSWEQSRLVAYVIAQTNSRKKLKFEDITKFYWEGKENVEDTKITKTDIERLNKMAQAYINENK